MTGHSMTPTNSIGYLLQHLSSVLAKQSDQALQEKLGLGFSQFKILMVLQWNPSVQQRHIAESLGQTEASISRQIKIMLDREWLKSTVSPTNRREHITMLTDKGVEMTKKARQVLNTHHTPMFGQLNQKELNEMLEMLKKMHTYVCQHGKMGACDHPMGI